MKRYAATALWTYSFWYLGSMIAGMLGVPDLLGPVLGISTGIVVGADPRKLIWVRPGLPTQAQAPAAA